MITEYELYSDERYQDSQYLFLGGIICTQRRTTILQGVLNNVRSNYKLTREMRWTKVSKQYLDAYKAWVDVFFGDPYPRFSVLKVDLSDPDWHSFKQRTGRKQNRDEKLSSAFYQFLLVSFGPLRDTKRWWIYPDAGFFSRDKVLDSVEFLFNRTYKKAFGAKTSRIIRMARAQDSKNQDLIQLADILLGVISCDITDHLPKSTARRALVEYYRERHDAAQVTRRNMAKISVNDWQKPDNVQFPR